MKTPRLQHELKKKLPFASLEQEATLNIVRTSDRLQICFARLLREHDLTPSQYNVLRILRGEGRPLPILDIAERMVAVVPAITGLIDRLEALGLVARERCTSDRRVIFVCLTEAGGKAVGTLDEPIQSLNRRLLGHLSGSELKELNRLLVKARTPPADAPA